MMMIPAMAGLNFLLGFLLGKARRNWFIGIRTPWTLSSESVWVKTHRCGSQYFKITAGVTLLGLWFPDLAVLYIILSVLSLSLYLVVFSYIEYKRENRQS